MAVAFVKNHTVASNKTAGTTLDLPLDTDVPAGNLIVARLVFDNAATGGKPLVLTAARAAGETNTWLEGAVANSASTSAGAFASGAWWCLRTSVIWPAGSYTFTLDTSTVQKAGAFQEFSGALGVKRGTRGTAYSTTTTAASATTTGTTPVIGDVAIGFIFGSNVAAAQAGDNDTTGGSWSAVAGVGTTGGSGTTNNYGVGQYKILTAASHQTLNNSAAMTAGNGAIVAILEQYVPPAITQAAYQFYADGTETGATALAAADTGYTADTSSGDVNLQVRTRLQSTTAVAVPTTDDWQLQWEKTPGTGTLADSYPETNVDTASSFAAGTMWGQSFTGDGKLLARVGFRLSRQASTTGNLICYLYATDTGSVSTGIATGSPLATSTAVPVSSLVEISTPDAWVYFDFDSTVTSSNGVAYAVAVGHDCPDALKIGADNSSPTHAGKRQVHNGTSWSANTLWDLPFEVYTKTVTSGNVAASGGTVNAYASANLTDGAATTNRLGAGTGSFVAGKISEDGLVDDLGWSANNYTEVLYSVTLKQADLAPTDTLKFRVLRNAATTNMTYTQVPTITIGAGAPTDRTGTATGAITLSGTASGSKTVTATAAGTVTVAGAASGSAAAAPVLGVATGQLTVTGAAAGQKTVTAVVSGSVTVAGTAVGVRGRPGVATGQLTVAGTAAGTHGVTGAATGQVSLTGAAAGVVSGAVTGQAVATLSIVGTAAGVKTVAATAAGAITVTGAASGQKTVRATATGAITVVGVAAGTKTVTATATGQLTLAGVATGIKTVTATAAGQITLNSVALGLVEGNAVGRAIGQVTVGGTATGVRGRPGQATGTLTVVGVAVGHRATTATATGAITVAGLAVAVRANIGTATGTITITGTALGRIPVAFDIAGQWNGQAVDALQWGDHTVVDWYMVPT